MKIYEIKFCVYCCCHASKPSNFYLYFVLQTFPAPPPPVQRVCVHFFFLSSKDTVQIFAIRNEGIAQWNTYHGSAGFGGNVAGTIQTSVNFAKCCWLSEPLLWA